MSVEIWAGRLKLDFRRALEHHAKFPDMRPRTIILWLSLTASSVLAQEYLPTWQAVLTTDTDVVFSIRLPQESYESEDFAKFPVRISHPDGSVEEYTVQLWRTGEGATHLSDSAEPPPEPKAIEPDSPLSLIHKRVFYPKQFQAWDETLRDLGPRHEELLESRTHDDSLP